MASEPIRLTGQPDPGRVSTLADFGRELTLARERAGLTVRQVARAAGIPASTAGDYFAGRHLPSTSQAGTLRKIVLACGVSVPDQMDAWVQAAARVRQCLGRPAHTVAPYRGLAAFEAEDAGWFFGRDDLTSLLTSVVTSGTSGTPVTVTGPSGAGKSSLLRAGLIPWLTVAPDPGTGQGGWQTVLCTPGVSPLASLIRHIGDVTGKAPGEAGDWLRDRMAEAGGPRAGTPGGAGQHVPPGAGHPGALTGAGAGRLALVVDQFEEVFTACPEEAERQRYIAAVSALAGSWLVVLGLRADFYGHALRYPELAASLQHRQVVVGPMTRDQLRQAIVEPARKARLALEPGLAELLLSEVAPVTGLDLVAPGGHEAGSLPLLSHALLATWERGLRNQLTVADYVAVGGIRDAVARTAEAAYAALGDEEKEHARHLFLRLVHVSDDSPLTRAVVPLDELQDRSPGDGIEGGVLARFVEDRLVTLDENTAQITHEALLSAWPRLREWIDANLESLKIRERIVSAAKAWHEAGRDDATLLRGSPLAVAADWSARAGNRGSLSQLARDFVDSSRAHEQARVASERRRVGRLRQLVAALVVLVLLAGGLAAYAFQQRDAAAVSRNQADSREVAVEAGQIRGQDPALAAQLSLAAFKISPTQSAVASLLESAAYPAAARLRDSASVVQAVALAAGHRTLAVAAADGTLRLWDVARPGHPFPLGAPLTGPGRSPLYAATFSPDGRLLAAAGAGRTVRLWNVASPRHPVPLGPPLTGPHGTVYSLAFSPDGRVLAAGSADDSIRLWDTSDPRHPLPLGGPLTGPTGYVEAIAFSPGGALLAAASADGTVWLWNISSPRHPVRLGRPLTGPSGVVDSVAFSPDGHTLAAGSRDNSVRLWNITRPAHPVPVRSLTSATDWINAVAFSPDGAVLAAASSDDQVLLWNAATGALLATLPGPQPVTSLAWDGDATLIAGSADGFVRLWRVPPPILLAGGPVNQVAFSPHGTFLAVAGPSLQLWDAATRTRVASATVPGAVPNAVAWAPGGSLVATGYTDGTLRLWLAAHGHLRRLGVPLRASTLGMIESVAFRADGRVLATSADDGTIHLWNVADPSHPVPLAVIHDSAMYVFSAAFSPNGRILAAASADNLVRLWDVSDPARPRLLGRPLTGPSSYAISVAFSPGGSILAVGSADHTVRLWNVANPRRPRRAGRPLTGPGGYVYSVAFSPGGTTLAGGVTDGTVWLWNVANPARPTLITHLYDAMNATGHVYSVSFSPSGGTLAAGSSDGSVRLFDTHLSAAAASVCDTAGQPLTRAEWNAYIPGRRYRPPCS